MGTASPTSRLVLAVAALVLTSCTGSEEPSGGRTPEPRSSEPPATGAALPEDLPAATLDPDDFVAQIDNEHLPLLPGTRWVYRVTSSEGNERIVVEVADRTREVAGVRATVVRDRVWAEGRLVEDTFDWFAQDRSGNVWYLGEDTTAFEDGRSTHEGSWETGVDGAEAGVVMPAVPTVGQTYPQEYLPGEAEDRGRVVALGVPVRVPVGWFAATVETEDTTPLEPHLVERKYYAPGVGVVLERTVSGGDERVRLVAFRKP